MIWYIKWKIIESESSNITILTSSWIWYEIIINELTYWKLNSLDREDMHLFIFHQKTENSELLFWFLEKEEKQIFKELIKISWIWWRNAILLLNLWVDKLIESIIQKDNKTIESVKWIWKKMTEKIILELKDKDFIKDYDLKSRNNYENKNEIKKYDDIINSLTTMWYESEKIKEILKETPESIKETWEIIWFVIRKLNK